MHSKIYNLEEVNSRYINNDYDENEIEERMVESGNADYVENTKKEITEILAKETNIGTLTSKISWTINNFGEFRFISEDYPEMPEMEWLEMQMNHANEEEIKLKLVHAYDYHC